jgi:hypothetical protein
VHTCKLPLSQSTLPWTNATMQHGNATKSKNLLTLPRRLDRPSGIWPPRGG